MYKKIIVNISMVSLQSNYLHCHWFVWFCTAVIPSNTYLLTQTYSPFLWSFPISCALFCRLLLNNNTPVTGSTSPTLIQVDVESCIFYCYFSPGSKVRSRSSVAAGIQTKFLTWRCSSKDWSAWSSSTSSSWSLG